MHTRNRSARGGSLRTVLQKLACCVGVNGMELRIGLQRGGEPAARLTTMAGMPRDERDVILQVGILRAAARGPLGIHASLSPSSRRGEHPRHRVVGIYLVAAFGEVGARGCKRLGQMFAMFRAV